MAIISKDSWHFAIAKQSERFNIEKTRDICKYMKCIRNILARDIALTIASFYYLLGNLIIVTALYYWAPPPGDESVGLAITFIVTLCIDFILLLCGLVVLFNLAKDWYYSKYPEKLYKVREPSIFKVYWKSFHDQVCILITYK